MTRTGNTNCPPIYPPYLEKDVLTAIFVRSSDRRIFHNSDHARLPPYLIRMFPFFLTESWKFAFPLGFPYSRHVIILLLTQTSNFISLLFIIARYIEEDRAHSKDLTSPSYSCPSDRIHQEIH